MWNTGHPSKYRENFPLSNVADVTITRSPPLRLLTASRSNANNTSVATVRSWASSSIITEYRPLLAAPVCSKVLLPGQTRPAQPRQTHREDLSFVEQVRPEPELAIEPGQAVNSGGCVLLLNLSVFLIILKCFYNVLSKLLIISLT